MRAHGGSQGVALGATWGQPRVLQPPSVSSKPVGRHVAPQPVGGDDGERIARMASGLPHAFPAVERLERREPRGRVRPLAAPRLEQTGRAAAEEERRKQPRLRLPRAQAAPKRAEHRGVKARIGQLQRQGIRPGHPPAHRVRGLAVGPTLGTRPDGHQHQASGCFGALASTRPARGQGLVRGQRTKRIAPPPIDMPCRKGCARDPCGRLGYTVKGVRVS